LGIGALAGALGGTVTGVVLRSVRPSRQSWNALVFCWAVAGGLGSALTWAFQAYYQTVAFYAVAGAATGATVGLVGALLMFSYLSGDRQQAESRLNDR
jgi:hypothetical protein